MFMKLRIGLNWLEVVSYGGFLWTQTNIRGTYKKKSFDQLSNSQIFRNTH
jgi:hypothetical protein